MTMGASPGSSVSGDFPGKYAGVACQAFLQGIFPAQGLEPGFLALQVNSLPSQPTGKYDKSNTLL